MTMVCLIADQVFYTPVLREYSMAMGCKSIGKKTMDALMDENIPLAIFPGGIYEQMNTDCQQEQLWIPENLMFIRMAIEKG
eukprot:CAMPEP_0116898160 /NCGR_PEP_ID=MMETSP0467-20121206/6933_1 /TAXON_ID=283647 /ORGANISM="Mesodinium pulex, Strain SPMC105" /LENGTH=80 /DNA_ID=CAMNT_0004570111 /DNA_START=339 /DNA_END=581 /DNA_ORIENTATION=-